MLKGPNHSIVPKTQANDWYSMLRNEKYPIHCFERQGAVYYTLCGHCKHK